MLQLFWALIGLLRLLDNRPLRFVLSISLPLSSNFWYIDLPTLTSVIGHQRGAIWSQVQSRNRIRFFLVILLFCLVIGCFDWSEGCATAMGSMRATTVAKQHGSEPDLVHGPAQLCQFSL